MPMEVPPSQVQSIAEQSAPAGATLSSALVQYSAATADADGALGNTRIGDRIVDHDPDQGAAQRLPAQYSFAANEAPFENPATTTSAHCVAATAWATTSTADA